MAVVVLFNPRSGRGRGAAALSAVDHAVRAVGESARVIATGPEHADELRDALGDAVALVVIGGDGTVHHALSPALAAGVPLAVWPTGTENLLARELRMRAEPTDLARRLARRRVLSLDVAQVERSAPVAASRAFVLMASLGPDAGIIHRMARTRGGPILRWSYLRPMLEEIWSPSLRPMTIEVDGQTLVCETPGHLVVANARAYAARIDPAPRASMRDGLLDIVFFPARSASAVTWWAVRAWLRSANAGAARARGRRVRVTAVGVPVQVDGEALWADAGAVTIAVCESRLKVLS